MTLTQCAKELLKNGLLDVRSSETIENAMFKISGLMLLAAFTLIGCHKEEEVKTKQFYIA